ncbi:peroxidase-like [Bacillus rossius redtenbacheri]|uniref:peroxidase-like n=1 Tax=Bacillus rossius redtenbacheri TaxID=93214 RepID=UPI002FDE2512
MVAPQAMILLTLLAASRAQQQQPPPPPFRTQLFEEQLQQQQLQLAQQAMQLQLQDLQRQMQVSQSPPAQAELQKRQAELMRRIEDSQRQQQVLQDQLQARLGGAPPQLQLQEPVLVALPPEDEDLSQRQQPVVVSLPPEDEDLSQRQEPARLPPAPAPQPPGPGLLQPLPVVLLVEAAPPCSTLSGEAGLCRPLVRCITFYTELPELRRQPCRLPTSEPGVCCPLRQRPPAVAPGPSNGVLRAPPPPAVVIPPLSPQQLDHAASLALDSVRRRLEFVASLFANHVVVQPGTPAAWHQEFFITTNDTLSAGQQAQKTVEASVSLVNQFNLTADQGTFALPTFSVLNTVIADTCSPAASCFPTKYRSPDGSCNNLVHDRWGSAGTALQRVLPPKYGDGVNSPRSLAASGKELPSARLVSTQFAKDVDRPHENYTVMVMQWGQFLDHDLTHTPISRGTNGFGLSCCRDGKVINATLMHPDCFPITLPNNDHIFAPFGERCMEFVRSLPAPRPECNFGPREQMDQITGYLDGSNIYGSSLEGQRELREMSGGRLKVQDLRGRPMLPKNDGECVDETNTLTCFKAGDSRVNEQVELAVMHTLWMREHNRVAGELERLHPAWKDETLFQESRRIVVAEMQHITYNEFLPLVLGRNYMDQFELAPRDSNFTRLYDDALNAGITNVFATAAFRFGHTLIQGHMKGLSQFGTVRQDLLLHQHHFSPFVLYKEGALDDFVRGLSTQTCQRFDRFFSSELTDHLFQGDLDFGLDLVALNIQRGRDHGLPPYDDWRAVCGLPRASWDQLRNDMDPASVEMLRRLYDDVHEVDLFVAAVAEKPLPGALMGPTFVCLVGDQFARLRRGDRFFYEEGGQPSSFTHSQLQQIRRASLARVLCDNSDDIAVMQPLAFLQASLLNQKVGCASESIPKVDLSAWAN